MARVTLRIHVLPLLFVAIFAVAGACSSGDETTRITTLSTPQISPTPSGRSIVVVSTPATVRPQTPTPPVTAPGPEVLTPTSKLVEPTPTSTPTPPVILTSTATPEVTVPVVTTNPIIPTPTLFPTATIVPPTPTPLPTSTPLPTAGQYSDRYGLITHTDNTNTVNWMLDQFSANHYIDFTSDPSTAPVGKSKLITIQVARATPMSPSQIADIAAARPGATWYVGGEPNRLIDVDDVIENFRYYYEEIRAADPTARITSPSMLNWDFTCLGCGGYTSGEDWLKLFVDRYQQLYGALPEWDVWAIDLYPLDWGNLPNNRSDIPIDQLGKYRAYIDSLPGRSGDPIIITELGIHWGWDQAVFGIPGCSSPAPSGTYRADVMIEYFDTVFTWLEANAISSNIERWFTYITYSDISVCRSNSYAGISLFNSGSVGATLSEVGQWYQIRSSP